MIRLDKYLADMGIGTRAEVKKYIKQGKVSVDGIVVKTSDMKVDADNQKVFFQGKYVGYETFEYYMLHKPAGVVSATTDAKDKTVIDLISDKKRKDLFPVGRLDKDTEGLLLITNDGDMAHRLLSPKKHVDKVYFAKVDGRVTQEDIITFEQGVSIGQDEVAKPAKLEVIKADEISEIQVTIQEGKYHQVKRMFHTIGKEVLYLKRISMGSLVLDDSLPVGTYRKLTREELEDLC